MLERTEGGAELVLETDGGLYAVGLVSGRTEDAGVHGFGAQTAPFDLDGRLLPIVVREQGVGRGEQPLTFLADVTNHGAGGTQAMTYGAWSSFVTDDLRGLRLDPDAGGEPRLRRGRPARPLPGGAGGVVEPPARRGHVGHRPRRPRRPSSRAGPVAELADWPLEGAIVGLQGGTSEVREHLDALLAADAAVSAVWIQDWTGRRITGFGDRLWWTWQRDEAWYPGWSRLVDELADEGIRVTTYVNPFLVDASAATRRRRRASATCGRRPSTSASWCGAPTAAPYELDQGGFDASLVDLTNGRARSWYADVLAEEVLGDGVSGFMADFGEGLPFDAELDRRAARATTTTGGPRCGHGPWRWRASAPSSPTA